MALFATVAVLGLAAPALGQVVECDGLRRPDYDACDSLIEGAGWENSAEYLNNDIDGGCEEICKGRMFENAQRNCVLSVCFSTSSCVGALQSSLFVEYESIIKNWCEPQDAGGVRPSDNWDFSAYNEPNFSGSESVDQFAKSKTVLDNGLTEFTMSRGDFDEWLNLTAKAAPARSSRIKRQSDTWNTLSINRNVARSGHREQASAVLSSGVEQTWSFSDTKTVTTSVSSEFGANLWDIFSASVSVETSESHSETIQEGMTFTVGDCPNEGIVYYVPLWNNYRGYWSSDDQTEVDVWIPQAQGDFVSGRFVTECLG